MSVNLMNNVLLAEKYHMPIPSSVHLSVFYNIYSSRFWIFVFLRYYAYSGHLSHFYWIQADLLLSHSGIMLALSILLQNVLLHQSVWYTRQQASSCLPVGCASHSLCSLDTLVLLPSYEGKGVAAVADWL